ncbi:hypothetical protein LXL04_031644 [Taraxacum kok-saghyz]
MAVAGMGKMAGPGTLARKKTDGAAGNAADDRTIRRVRGCWSLLNRRRRKRMQRAAGNLQLEEKRSCRRKSSSRQQQMIREAARSLKGGLVGRRSCVGDAQVKKVELRTWCTSQGIEGVKHGSDLLPASQTDDLPQTDDLLFHLSSCLFVPATLSIKPIDMFFLVLKTSNDCMVRSWLLNAISKEIVGAFIFATTARELWIELEEHFSESNGPLIYQLQRQIASIHQGDSSVSKYYTKLKQLWDQLNCLMQLPMCNCGSAKARSDFASSTRLMQFLMELNDTYENLRNQVLVLDPLPPVHKAYSMALSVEKQNEVQINFSTPPESAMFVKTSNHNADKKQISYKPKTDLKNKNNNDRYCNHCKVNGHTRDSCFKLNGYPDWYKDLKDKKKGNMNSAHKAQDNNPLFDNNEPSGNDNTDQMNVLFQQFRQFMKNNQNQKDLKTKEVVAEGKVAGKLYILDSNCLLNVMNKSFKDHKSMDDKSCNATYYCNSDNG